MRAAWVLLVLLLLSGCAAKPAKTSTAASATTTSSGPVLPVSYPIKFAAGNQESAESFSATFQDTDVCLPTCTGSADQKFDLTKDVPADAPVALNLALHGIGQGYRVNLHYTDAGATRMTQQRTNGDLQIAALLVRSASGTVTLEISKQATQVAGSLNGTSTANVVGIDVHSVVQGDLLVPNVPAALALKVGDQVKFNETSLKEALLMAPDGSIQRVQAAPFNFTINGTGGLYTVMVLGDQPTQVFGPNVTMAARRTTTVTGTPHDITQGTPLSWTFTAPSAPLLVGLSFSTKPAAGPVDGVDLLGPYSADITSPGNVKVLQHNAANCPQGPFCSFSIVRGQEFTMESDFLDDNLVPGQYTATVSTQQSNDFQVQDYAEYILTS